MSFSVYDLPYSYVKNVSFQLELFILKAHHIKLHTSSVLNRCIFGFFFQIFTFCLKFLKSFD